MPRSVDNNLAEPAPKVDAATVSCILSVEPATASPASPVGAATVEPVASVEPATLYKTPTVEPSSLEGLSTKKLRGSSGADFESYAAVIKGAVQKNFLQIFCPCVYDERDFVSYGEVKNYVLVKDGYAYIYVHESDPSPLYAFELNRYIPVLEDPEKPERTSWTVSPMPDTNLSRPSMKTILLKKKTDGNQAFQLTFDTEHDPTLAKTFIGLFDVKKTPLKK